MVTTTRIAAAGASCWRAAPAGNTPASNAGSPRRGAGGTVRGGKPTAAITFGHSKDHRPDLKRALYPEFRDCTAPSTERILEIFTNLTRHQLHHDGILVKTFEPELTTQQQQVLDLLGLAPAAHRPHSTGNYPDNPAEMCGTSAK